jgi:hypothetical protein
MKTNTDLIKWAAERTQQLISPLGNRWLHIQGVVERARTISHLFDNNDQTYLIAAAYLHDIGYVPELRKTGFHPLDGAYYLLSHDQERLASLVAYHSEAQCEANLRGLAKELEKIPREYSALADALTYCDMTTSPTGQEITFEERIDDILSRYDETHIVAKAIREAVPSLALAVERILAILYYPKNEKKNMKM